jgi:hypothetical protein
MLTRAIAVTVSLALAAVPGTAQTEHQHDHTQEEKPSATQDMMMHEMMMACPFFETMGMSGEMKGMMNESMMGGGTMNQRMMNHEMMKGMGEHMIGNGMQGPLDLIGMKDQLNLSEEQVADLEGLNSRILLAMQRQMTTARSHRSVARKTFEENPEGFGEYSEALRAAGGHMLDAHILLIQSRFEAREILTPIQKRVLSQGPPEMHQSMKMDGGMIDLGIVKSRLVSGSGGQGWVPAPAQG